MQKQIEYRPSIRLNDSRHWDGNMEMKTKLKFSPLRLSVMCVCYNMFKLSGLWVVCFVCLWVFAPWYAIDLLVLTLFLVRGNLQLVCVCVEQKHINWKHTNEYTHTHTPRGCCLKRTQSFVCQWIGKVEYIKSKRLMLFCVLFFSFTLVEETAKTDILSLGRKMCV